MKLKKFTRIDEGLGQYKLLGNFDKNSSFRERDRRLVSHPLTKEKLGQKLGHLPFTVNTFFVNSPKARKHTEVGMVDLDWVKRELGDEVFTEVQPHAGQKDTINIIYTNNKGAEGIVLTPWMMMHRMAHSLARYKFHMPGAGRQFKDYSDAVRNLIYSTHEILSMYGYEDFPESEDRLQRSRKDQLIMISLFSQIATFRSARTKNIRDYFEILNELFAQYMTTGDIKFNPAPSSIKVSLPKFDRKYLNRSPKDVHADQYIIDILESLSHTLKNDFTKLLKDTERGILVM